MPATAPVLRRLSTLDRFLPLWPLVEVPALIGLVYVSLWAGRRYFGFDPEAVQPEAR